MDKQALLTHINQEVQLSRDFVDTKRDIFRNRLRQYIEPNKADDKIDSNLIYSAVNTAVAIAYADKLNVVFAPRKFGDEEYAENLTETAQYDYDEMSMPIINFQKEWDRHFYGVGIRVKSGWDENRSCPIVTVKDPLSWLPDPTGNHIDPFRFHYFEEDVAKDSLKAEYGFDEEEVNAMGIEINQDLQNNKSYFNNAQGLNNIIEEKIDNPNTSVINGYTTFNGIRYAVTVNSDITRVLRAVEIEPITKEEKKDPSLIEYPVVVSYYSPLRGDPYGVCIPDLMEDKQKAHKILSNLRLIGAKFATFGQQYLYDPRAIKNVEDIKRPSTNPKYTPYNSVSGVPISQALYPVPRENIMADSFNVSNEIISQVYKDTGIDARTLGVQWEKNITLGESQQIQANANVRMGLNIAVNFWSEKKFWRLWLRCYLEYFGAGDRKYIRITKGFESVPTELRRDDFLGIQDPDIYIDSEANISAKREKDKLSFQAQLPLILSDPSIPQISKTYALRYSLKLNGVPREMIKIMTFNNTEVDARNKVALLNANDMAGAEIDDINEDHLTYLIMFENALDTPAKMEAIRRRREAIILAWQSGPNQQNGNMQWIANASAAQMTNAALQNNNGWIVSTQSIAQ